MKIDSKTLILAAGLGVLVWALMKPKPNPNQWQQYLPPPPQQTGGSNAQEWQSWINLAVNTFGNVASLWAPGGPFYNNPEVSNYIQPPAPGQNSPFV